MAGLKKQNGLQAANVHHQKSLKKRIYEYRWFYLMFLPVFLTIVIYGYFPMAGILYAFTEYTPFTDPVFIGFENFKVLFSRPHNRGLSVKQYGIHRAETWDEADALVTRYTKEMRI